ncbi:MAG: phenylalanine--tRNA ligase subunit beta [Nanoarchaeota archaeon]|nr:phenylalanine--tRNA ligase subunit beta [Nanoarchaeota archaeon]
MPTLEISKKDLEQLIGKKLPENKEELFSKIKAEVEKEVGDTITLELNDTNRVDLWSVEGIARELKGHLGVDEGIKRYKARKSKYVINAGEIKVRPYIAACVVKGVELNNHVIKQLMQQQEKIDSTYGRTRKKTSIGLYNLDALTFPLTYDEASQDTEFVPLGFKQKMSLKQILKKHPKGVAYAHILEGVDKPPLFTDATGKILSMPPIINSNELGQIKPEHTNLLVEVTGTNEEAVRNVLTLITTSLFDRGGTLYDVTIKYSNRRSITPVFENTSLRVKPEEINKELGLELEPEEIVELLRKMRYNAFSRGKIIDVQVSSYRVDVIHPVDVTEDVAIAFGYDKIEPEMPKAFTVGGVSKKTKQERLLRKLFTSMGCQEIRNMVLTNTEKLFEKMNAKKSKFIEIENPVNESYTCARNALLPGLVNTLSKNTHAEYPQKIFEVGQVIRTSSNDMGSKTKTGAGMCVASKETSFSEIKQHLDWFMKSRGINYSLKPSKNKAFIEGRCGEIIVKNRSVGIIGEVHPAVLKNNQLKMPVTCFEVTENG